MSETAKCVCGHRFDVPDEDAGKLAECPKCGQFVLPASADEDVGATVMADPDRPAGEEDGLFELADPTSDPAPPIEISVPSDVTRTPEPDGDGSGLIGVAESSDDPTAEGPCPNCRTPMSSGAVLCTQCGWNRVLGQFVSKTGPEIKREERMGVGGVASGLWLTLAGFLHRFRYWLIGGVALASVATVIVVWIVGEQRRMSRSQGSAVGEMVGDFQSDMRKQKQRIHRDHVGPEEARGMYLDAQSAHQKKDTLRAIKILKELMQFYAGTEYADKAPELIQHYELILQGAASRPAGDIPTSMPTVTDPVLKPIAGLIRRGWVEQAIGRLEDLLILEEGTETGRAAQELLDWLRQPSTQPAPTSAPASAPSTGPT